MGQIYRNPYDEVHVYDEDDPQPLNSCVSATHAFRSTPLRTELLHMEMMTTSDTNLQRFLVGVARVARASR